MYHLIHKHHTLPMTQFQLSMRRKADMKNYKAASLSGQSAVLPLGLIKLFDLQDTMRDLFRASLWWLSPESLASQIHLKKTIGLAGGLTFRQGWEISSLLRNCWAP